MISSHYLEILGILYLDKMLGARDILKKYIIRYIIFFKVLYMCMINILDSEYLSH